MKKETWRALYDKQNEVNRALQSAKQSPDRDEQIQELCAAADVSQKLLVCLSNILLSKGKLL